MKTAEEWFRQLDEMLTDNPDVDQCRDCLRSTIKQIQLDAYRAGGLKAAEIPRMSGEEHFSPTLRAHHFDDAAAILTHFNNSKLELEQ